MLSYKRSEIVPDKSSNFIAPPFLYRAKCQIVEYPYAWRWKR